MVSPGSASPESSGGTTATSNFTRHTTMTCCHSGSVARACPSPSSYVALDDQAITFRFGRFEGRIELTEIEGVEPMKGRNRVGPVALGLDLTIQAEQAE